MLIRFLSVIVLFNFGFIYPQELKISDIFFNSWIDNDFYECIISGGTPRECAGDNSISYVFFPRSSDSVFIGTLLEGDCFYYTVSGGDSIFIYNHNESEVIASITLLNSLDSTIIYETPQKKKYKLKALGWKYYSIRAFNIFINDNCFTGKYYISEKSNKEISFTSDSKVIGFDDFDTYYITSQRIDTPSFDIIILRSAKTKLNRFYHWKKNENRIMLYNISYSDNSGNFDRGEISTQYLELIKK